MMQTLGEFLSPEAGQARRKWLDESLGQFIPPELRGWVGAGAELNPVTNVERAGTAARRMTAPGISGWDRMAAAGDMATNMGAVLAPVAVASKTGVPAANAIVEALTAASPMKGAADEFLVDEFGGVGFRAYHGSPHDFDRFSLDKIGTGEGAQAYGHGLYFAEREGVARSYRDALTSPVDYRGQGYPGADSNLAAKKVADAMGPNSNPANVIASEANKFRYQAQQMRAALSGQSGAAREANERLAASFEKIAADIESLNPDDFRLNTGRMYEVQINADPADFLDWDKPLSEQPAAVRDIAAPFVQGMQSKFPNYNPTGDTIYRQIEGGRIGGVGGDFAASALRDAGIPGIRYLDAGSRGAGDGSRNYVVFDDKLIEILRKYGLAGAVPMGALLSQPQDPMGSYLEAQ